MRKLILIIGSILIMVILVIIIIWQNYKNSPEYNFISAKLDIKNGNARIINMGPRKITLKDKEIDEVSDKYGFKNIFIGYDTTKQNISGINNYNEVMEAYLKVRNGINWRKYYQLEFDSIYKEASIQNN